MKIRWMIIFLLGIALPITADLTAAAPQEPAAVVTQVSGEVFLRREGAPKKVKVELASFLLAGDRLDLSPGANLTLAYFQGCRQDILKGKGSVKVLADKTQDAGKTLVSSTPLKKCGSPPKVTITDESSIAKGVVTLRGGAVARLSPSETKVAGVNPLFSWQTARSVLPQRFTVALYDKSLRKLWQARTEYPALELRYPQEAPPLQPGEMYRWSVNESVAYFAVAAPEETGTLEEKRKAYEPAAGAPEADLTYLLFSALLYEEAGFNLEAARYYQRVLQLAPSSRQIHLRLAEIYARMGWSAEAERELEEAKGIGE